jgi:hypothetical protein
MVAAGPGPSGQLKPYSGTPSTTLLAGIWLVAYRVTARTQPIGAVAPGAELAQ